MLSAIQAKFVSDHASLPRDLYLGNSLRAAVNSSGLLPREIESVSHDINTIKACMDTHALINFTSPRFAAWFAGAQSRARKSGGRNSPSPQPGKAFRQPKTGWSLIRLEPLPESFSKTYEEQVDIFHKLFKSRVTSMGEIYVASLAIFDDYGTDITRGQDMRSSTLGGKNSRGATYTLRRPNGVGNCVVTGMFPPDKASKNVGALDVIDLIGK